MTAKLISIAGLLLMLSSPAFAAEPEPAVQAPVPPEQAQTAQTPQPDQSPQVLAWQRVGAPLTLEG